MSSASLGHRLGNHLYRVAFPIYRPLYTAFKACVDRTERQFLARYLSDGCIAVDAGANIGVYSRFLSKCVGPTGLVHSFEPAPDNFVRLRTMVAGLANVRANQLAVSDTTGEQLLYLSGSLNVDHRTYRTNGESRQTVSVHSTRIDDYFEPHERADLIKLDVQGYELHVLRGAQRVLMDNPTIKLLIEFWPYGLREAGSSPEAMFSFLRHHGFTVFAFNDDELKECDQSLAYGNDRNSYFNLFAQRADNQIVKGRYHQ